MSSNFPSGFNAQSLSPTVRIYDTDDVLQYEYESESAGGSTRDFNLNSFTIHNGVNDNYGYAELLIEDHDNIMVESTSDKTSVIKTQWRVDIYLGKGIEGDKWFRGKVFNASVHRPNNQNQYIRVWCVGWGIVAAERISKIDRIQSRAANGLDFDNTDTTTQLDELFRDIWEDTDHYPLRSLGTVPGITLDIQASTLKLTEFKDSYQSWSFLMSRLAAIGNRMFGFNPDLTVWFRDQTTVSSGLLLSADESNVISKMWNPANLCYVTGPISFQDDTGETGYSVLHAPGASADSVDINVDPTLNAQSNLFNNWVAIEFIPNEQQLSKISVRAARPSGAGANTGDAFFRIVGEGGGGVPDLNDTRKRVRIPVEKITNDFVETPTTSLWHQFSFERIATEPDNRLFVVFEEYGAAATNSFALQYDSGGSNNYYTSTNGTSWGTVQNGDFALRTYPFRTFNLIYQNTVARREFGIREKVVDIKNFTDFNTLKDTMIGLGRILSKQRRLFNTVTVSVPDNYVEPGKTCRIIDKLGLDQQVVILGWTISASVGNAEEMLGANTMQIQVETF